MNKESFLTAISIFGVVAALAISIPLSELKADHCHTDQSQPPAPTVKEPAGTKATNAQRQRTRANAPVPEGRSVGSGAVSPSGVPAAPANPSLEEIYSRDLPIAILSIGQAIKAAETGDKKTELAELNKAVNTLVTIHAALGKHVKPQFVNSRCPIMGSPIGRDRVDPSLTRDYNGQKIAFCCGGCPSAWDKLTDTQKQAKLLGAKS